MLKVTFGGKCDYDKHKTMKFIGADMDFYIKKQALHIEILVYKNIIPKVRIVVDSFWS